MKKKYELNTALLFLYSIYFFILILVIIFLLNSKIVLFKTFNGAVYDNNILELVLSDSELELLYKNKVVYIDSLKTKFVIEKVEKAILKKADISYNKVFIKTTFSNNYKNDDIISVSIKKRSVKSINIFKVIWEVVLLEKIE